MYNFNLSKKNITDINEEINLLLSIKSLLPRYLNSIPDSEFICICKLLNKRGEEVSKKLGGPTFIETGCGASTIAFAYFAMKYHGKSYTWDSNTLKISEIRRVINESLALGLKFDLNNFWFPVQHLSNSRTVGINILSELNQKIDLYMHDSEHTHQTLISELELVIKNSNKTFYCLIDDAHYRFKNYDYAYSNLMRSKLNLKEIDPKNSEIGETMKNVAIEFFKSKKINFLDLDEQIEKIINNKNHQNHLVTHEKYLNVTGNKDRSESLTSARFAAFIIKI